MCVCGGERYRNETNYKGLESQFEKEIDGLVCPLVWVGRSGRVNRKAKLISHTGLLHTLI